MPLPPPAGAGLPGEGGWDKDTMVKKKNNKATKKHSIWMQRMYLESNAGVWWDGAGGMKVRQTERRMKMARQPE